TESAMISPKITGTRACVFDAYGTLFDVNSAARRSEELLRDKWLELADLWRTKQLQYTWLRSLTGRYVDFWQLTGEAHDFALDSLKLGNSRLREHLMGLYLNLGAYPEVESILLHLKNCGLKSAIWVSESRKLTTRDYRLFDIQHAVLPTALPLNEFYRELVETQRVLSIKHLGFSALREAAGLAADRLLHGQTNFVKMLWKFNSVYNPNLQISDHQQPVKYEISLPPDHQGKVDRQSLYIHSAKGRSGRQIDSATESFVESTRMGTD